MADRADLLRRIRAVREMKAPHPAYLLGLLAEVESLLTHCGG